MIKQSNNIELKFLTLIRMVNIMLKMFPNPNQFDLYIIHHLNLKFFFHPFSSVWINIYIGNLFSHSCDDDDDDDYTVSEVVYVCVDNARI